MWHATLAKCAKSWLGLDMATSVASATPCMDHFPVDEPGAALIYLAEDTLAMVRERIEALCDHRGLLIDNLDLHVIASPVLRLDLEVDQQRLVNVVEHLRPRMLLLDPLVRLHRLDENSAADVSRLLGYLRQLQRRFDTAVVLVHHASKKHRAQPGQALRGSGDLHAFGDDNLYFARRDEHLVLTMEHRAAKALDPIAVGLVSRADGSATHLATCQPVDTSYKAFESLGEAVVNLLTHENQPLYRTTIRRRLRVNNQRLGDVLGRLQQQGQLLKTRDGWRLTPASHRAQTTDQPDASS